jgi:hypothetical protein
VPENVYQSCACGVSMLPAPAPGTPFETVVPTVYEITFGAGTSKRRNL